jgi:hypothetical protein
MNDCGNGWNIQTAGCNISSHNNCPTFGLAKRFNRLKTGFLLTQVVYKRDNIFGEIAYKKDETHVDGSSIKWHWLRDCSLLMF